MKPAPTVITLFGSSRPREGDAEYAEARALGAALAGRGFAVATGGYGGVMEAASRGARESGGHTIGVTAEFFSAQANRWVAEEIRVATWEERLFELIRRGAGYVACRGGTGTLVELAVAWEMLNKGVVAPRPLVALGEFWRPVVERVREVEAAAESSERPATRPWRERDERVVLFAATPEDAAEILARALLP
jgi:uncharacterized protein (TIGR00725 family)